MLKGTALAVVAGATGFRLVTAKPDDKLSDAVVILLGSAAAAGVGSTMDKGSEAASLAAVGILGYLLFK
jgi:hypothetical protein